MSNYSVPTHEQLLEKVAGLDPVAIVAMAEKQDIQERIAFPPQWLDDEQTRMVQLVEEETLQAKNLFDDHDVPYDVSLSRFRTRGRIATESAWLLLELPLKLSDSRSPVGLILRRKPQIVCARRSERQDGPVHRFKKPRVLTSITESGLTLPKDGLVYSPHLARMALAFGVRTKLDGR